MKERQRLRPCHTERIPLTRSVSFKKLDLECIQCPQYSTCKKATEEKMSKKETTWATAPQIVHQQIAAIADAVGQVNDMFQTLLTMQTHNISEADLPAQSENTEREELNEFPLAPNPEPPPLRNLIAPRFEMGATYRLVGAEPTSDQRSFMWRQIDRVFYSRYRKRLRVLRENRNNAEPRPPKPGGRSGKWTRIDVAAELDMIGELYQVVCEVLPVPSDYFMPLERRPADESNLRTTHPHDDPAAEGSQTQSTDARTIGSNQRRQTG